MSVRALPPGTEYIGAIPKGAALKAAFGAHGYLYPGGEGLSSREKEEERRHERNRQASIAGRDEALEESIYAAYKKLETEFSEGTIKVSDKIVRCVHSLLSDVMYDDYKQMYLSRHRILTPGNTVNEDEVRDEYKKQLLAYVVRRVDEILEGIIILNKTHIITNLPNITNVSSLVKNGIPSIKSIKEKSGVMIDNTCLDVLLLLMPDYGKAEATGPFKQLVYYLCLLKVLCNPPSTDKDFKILLNSYISDALKSLVIPPPTPKGGAGSGSSTVPSTPTAVVTAPTPLTARANASSPPVTPGFSAGSNHSSAFARAAAAAVEAAMGPKKEEETFDPELGGGRRLKKRHSKRSTHKSTHRHNHRRSTHRRSHKSAHRRTHKSTHRRKSSRRRQ